MKITLATLKSFIRKNKGRLYIRKDSDFDGMVDCVMPVDGGFKQVESDNRPDNEHTLNIAKLWLVGSSRDYFKPFNNGLYEGYEISNCCGSQVLAIKKQI